MQLTMGRQYGRIFASSISVSQPVLRTASKKAATLRTHLIYLNVINFDWNNDLVSFTYFIIIHHMFFSKLIHFFLKTCYVVVPNCLLQGQKQSFILQNTVFKRSLLKLPLKWGGGSLLIEYFYCPCTTGFYSFALLQRNTKPGLLQIKIKNYDRQVFPAPRELHQ